MTEHRVMHELEAARIAVGRATHAMATGEGFDLREIERQVDLAAAVATDIGPDQRTDSLRSLLINLVADLDGLQKRIAAERRKTADQLGRSAVNRRAFAAYGDRVGG